MATYTKKTEQKVQEGTRVLKKRAKKNAPILSKRTKQYVKPALFGLLALVLLLVGIRFRRR